MTQYICQASDCAVRMTRLRGAITPVSCHATKLIKRLPAPNYIPKRRDQLYSKLHRYKLFSNGNEDYNKEMKTVRAFKAKPKKGDRKLATNK